MSADPDGAGPRPAVDERPPRQRLHPLTPLLRGAKVFAVVVAALSFQGFAQLGLLRFAAVVGIALVGGLVLSWVSWFVTGYHLIGRELHIQEGLLWRRHRAIPLERLQAVEVVRPVLARLTGLAELRLEVIGASDTEAPLAFLTVAEARELRDRLLALARGVTPTETTSAELAGSGIRSDTTTASPDQAEDVLHAVPTRDLLLAQLLTPQALALPVAAMAPALTFAFQPDLTFAGIATTVMAIVGVAQQPVRRVLRDYGFSIADAPSGLRLRHGLVETRSQTVPAHRVQAVEVTTPLLWRPMGWLRCRIDVAGYGGQEPDSMRAGTLLPVADQATTRTVVARVVPGLDVAALMLRPPPDRAAWRVPLQRRVLAAGFAADVFGVRSGLVTRQLVAVPYARIQSVRIVQGPWQRWLRLASVHADTAGALSVIAAHRDVDEARAMARELTERARSARAERRDAAASA